MRQGRSPRKLSGFELLCLSRKANKERVALRQAQGKL